MIHSGLKVDPRLAEQNNVKGWIDCNAVGLPHRWIIDDITPLARWFRCRRCPVGTRITSAVGSPPRFLGGRR